MPANAIEDSILKGEPLASTGRSKEALWLQKKKMASLFFAEEMKMKDEGWASSTEEDPNAGPQAPRRVRGKIRKHGKELYDRIKEVPDQSLIVDFNDQRRFGIAIQGKGEEKR